jgi:hypothetical protein
MNLILVVLFLPVQQTDQTVDESPDQNVLEEEESPNPPACPGDQQDTELCHGDAQIHIDGAALQGVRFYDIYLRVLCTKLFS